MIQQIANNESGSSVRSKLNEVIDIVNQEETGTLPNLSVGPTGDYTTINQALNRLTRMYPLMSVSGGVLRATITLQSNYVMNEQVLVNGLNLGWIRIQGTGVVTINRSALTTSLTDLDYSFTSYPAFGVINGGTLPVISGSFTMNTSGNASNQSIITVTGAGSSANLDAGSSLTNATGHNVAVGYGGMFQARDSTITGSLNRNNINVNNAGTASFNECILTGANNGFSVQATRNCRVSLHDSQIDNDGLNVNNGSIVSVTGTFSGSYSYQDNTLLPEGIIFRVP